MQSLTLIPDSTQLKDSLTPLLNNDQTALSCSSGTVFPTTNLLIGMLCYRTDQSKLYELTSTGPSVWTLLSDLSKSPVETDGSGNTSISGTFTANALVTASLTCSGLAGFQIPVTVKTVGYSLLAADSNGVFHNQGATTSISFILPSAVLNKKYTFYVHDAYAVNVVANSGCTIRNGTEVTAAAGNLSANSVGSLVEVIGVTSTEWIVKNITGTWTVT